MEFERIELKFPGSLETGCKPDFLPVELLKWVLVHPLTLSTPLKNPLKFPRHPYLFVLLGFQTFWLHLT